MSQNRPNMSVVLEVYDNDANNNSKGKAIFVTGHGGP
jgi:hypothetical protein